MLLRFLEELISEITACCATAHQLVQSIELWFIITAVEISKH